MENDHPSAAGRSLKLLWVAALVLAGAFLLREPYPSEDSAFFEYVGRALSEGRHLYSDLWDNKLPSVFLVNQLWWKLFGAHYRAHLLAEAIVCVLTVLLELTRSRGRRDVWDSSGGFMPALKVIG